jgi:signal transduction histidine kinase
MSDEALRTILLVDDSPEDRAAVRRLLRMGAPRFAVVEAETAAEALDRFRTVHPDLVLLDFHLPDQEGLEVLTAIGGGARPLPVPVVMLTGQEDAEVAVAALNGGAQDYILKGTLTAHGLGRTLENAVEKHAIEQELHAKTRSLEEKAEALELRNLELEMVRTILQTKVGELAEATRAKDQFLAVMSHEMRTPLNAIIGYADLLEMGIGGALGEGQRAHVDRIQVGGRHLLDLINDVLDLAKADARGLEIDLRPVDVQAVIEEVAALLESRARAQGIELVVQPCSEHLPHVMADLQRLRQILTNLVGNAIKFTEEGTVTIRCAPRAEALEISVEDTGVGIAPEVLPLVFDEFYQANGQLTRSRGGSGLGLAISQRLAKLMGGEVKAGSEIGVGSIFTVTIPTAATGSALRVEDVALHGQRMEGHGQRMERGRPPEPRTPVAVVAFGNDEHALAQLASRVQPGVRLAWTTDVDEVAGLATRERAALVVLEVAAGASAWNAAYALREIRELASSAVLLLPSIPAEGDEGAPEGLDLGWVSLVPKPFSAGQLTRAVTTAVRGEADPADGSASIAACDALIVDDDPDSRRVASRFLVAAGVSVRESPDGESALAEMRRRAPDVAVLDLMMPVLDGFGVLAAMRADPLLSGIPVVVLSAKSLNDAERRFLARTASRVLQKGEHRLADVAALVLRAASGAPPAV